MSEDTFKARLEDTLKSLQAQINAQAQMIGDLTGEVNEAKHTVSLLESRLTQTNADLNNKLEDSRPTMDARRRHLNRLYQLYGKETTGNNTTDTPHKGDK